MAVRSTSNKASAHRDERSFPVVVLAGGLGTRFGTDRPKQVTTVAGAPVLAHTLRRFDAHDLISQIVIPANEQWREEIEAVASEHICRKPFSVIAAGAHRNESVLNGLYELSGTAEIVAVHDGVRPLVSSELITATFAAMDGSDAAMPVIPIVDPVVEVSDGRVRRVVPREPLSRGQTPQVFRMPLLMEALTSGSFDATSVATLFEVVLFHKPQAVIATVVGDDQNLKITSPVDHLVAEQLLSGWKQVDPVEQLPGR